MHRSSAIDCAFHHFQVGELPAVYQVDVIDYPLPQMPCLVPIVETIIKLNDQILKISKIRHNACGTLWTYESYTWYNNLSAKGLKYSANIYGMQIDNSNFL